MKSVLVLPLRILRGIPDTRPSTNSLRYEVEWETQLMRFNYDGPRPDDKYIVEVVTGMREIQTFLKSFNAWLREDISFGREIDFILQGTPPGEGYAKAQEELAEMVSHANRRAEIQAWKLIRN